MKRHRSVWPRFRQACSLGLLVSFVAIVLSACSRDQAERSGGNPPRQTSPPPAPESANEPATVSPARILAGSVPDGWALTGAVEQYTPQNLYEKIDGLADLFLSYDVVGLTTASYKKSVNADLMIDAYVYDMGTPTNAFGIFSVERSPNEPPVDIGRIGYRSDASYFIWKGRYYVKIIAPEATDELAGVASVLARKVVQSLADSGERVWGLEAMPPANLVPQSLRYFRVDAMGLDFMRNTYTAQYRRGDSVVDIFVSRDDSPAAAQATLERYVQHARKYGRSVERLTVAGAKFERCDMGGTFDVIFTKGRLVAGVSAAKSPDIAVQAAADLWRQLSDPAGSR